MKVSDKMNLSNLGITFSTSNSKYFYDTKTEKVFKCEPAQYNILNDILNGIEVYDKYSDEEIEKVKTIIENSKILSNEDELQFYDGYKELIKHSTEMINQVVFELTENCNFRCKYCIYNEQSDFFRNFSAKNMDVETIKKALDYILPLAKGKLVIGFYGGEPLVRFDLIEETVNYINIHKPKDLKISYALTTNLSLMTRERAKFFANLEDCAITCSIDGPKIIHDNFRVSTNNEGTFDKTIEGLHNLVDAFEKRAKRCLSIYTVICPPYTDERLQAIYDFFTGLEWLPKEVNCENTKVKPGTYEIEDNTKNSNKLLSEPIKDFFLRKALETDDPFDYAVQAIRRIIIKVNNRRVSQIPDCIISMNGCCIPGQKRIYITTDGEFKVCEKIGYSPSIGNIETGFNKDELIKHYYYDYIEQSKNDCTHCWASKLCPLCFSNCYDENGFNLTTKRNDCTRAKNFVKDCLIIYHELLEKNPELLADIIKSTDV